MPWEAKRWVVFAVLMFGGSFLALNYRPEDAIGTAIAETEEEDKPTVPLTRPGPGEVPEPTQDTPPLPAPDAGATPADMPVP